MRKNKEAAPATGEDASNIGSNDGTSGLDDGLNTPMIAAVGAIIVIFVFAMVVGVQAMFFKVRDDENYNKYISQPPQEFSALAVEQQELLNSYHWIDEKRGVVGIPIERAMQIVARECATGVCEKAEK